MTVIHLLRVASVSTCFGPADDCRDLRLLLLRDRELRRSSPVLSYSESESSDSESSTKAVSIILKLYQE